MSRPRTFDYAEAKRRYAAGETLASISRALGVSFHAAKYAVDEDFRYSANAKGRKWAETNYRRPCAGTGCTRLVWTKAKGQTGLCPKCLGLSRRTAVHGSESKYRQGCRCGRCRTAMSTARRERREKTRVPCSHGCGRMVDSSGRRNPDKPYECLPCSNARIHGKLAA